MIGRALTLCVVLSAAAIVIASADLSAPRRLHEPFAAFPMTMNDWVGRQLPALDQRTAEVLGADEYLDRTYASGGDAVGLFLGFWGSQRQGDTIHSPLNCLPGSGWEPVSRRTVNLTVADGAGAAATGTIAINRYVIQKGAERALVLYWYQSHGRVVANEYVSRAYLVSDALRLHRTDAALVRVVVNIGTDAEGEARAERTGIRFAASVFPFLGTYLPS